MRPLLTLLLVSCTAWAGGLAQVPPSGPIGPGQVWRLKAVTAEGESFQITLRLRPQPPQGTPATYRADRGVLLVDQKNSSLIALDLADAADGGLALACAYIGPLEGQTFNGVLAAAPLENLPPLLEAALAVFGVATTAQDRAEASAELRLGRCTLTLVGEAG
jgi:hypothetical protein